MPKRKASEKLSEILFNAYFLRMFQLGEVEFYAPSQVDELELGYDAQFMGKGRVWEVILQFKQPRVRGNDGFTITLDQQQLRQLHRIKPQHVYYAAPAHANHREVADLQRQTRDPCDFLNTYILIDVTDLPPNTATIRFQREANGRFFLPRGARYRHIGTSTREDDHIAVRYRLTCDFVNMFRSRQIGVEVTLGNIQLPAQYAPTDEIDSFAAESRRPSLLSSLSAFVSKNELTLMVRLNEGESRG